MEQKGPRQVAYNAYRIDQRSHDEARSRTALAFPLVLQWPTLRSVILAER